jgi:hypothetical protein
VATARLLFLALLPLLSGQSGTIFLKRDAGRVELKSTLRADPPSSPLQRKFQVLLPRTRSGPNGSMFFSRVLLDNANRVYFGYELLIEQQQPGTYLATFGKLGVTPLDLAGNLRLSLNSDGSTNLDWTLAPLTEIPKPRAIRDSDMLTIVLFTDPATGEKLMDDIQLIPPRRLSPFLPVPPVPPPVPTVSGTARDFSAADAELQIGLVRSVTLNGARQAPVSFRNVRGPLLWLYVPDHGRYVFSLTPRPGLDFKEAGEVRGGVIAFAIGKDAITLECANAVATGDAAYHLYVLHDENWEPIAEAQKVRPGLGSVSLGELTALKKQ